MSDLTADLLAAVVAATQERKEVALRVLRGDATLADAATLRRGSGQAGPLLLGMGAAAKFLGVSRSTLWRVLQAGTIEKVELFSGSYRVRREDLEALALRRCSGQAAGRGGVGVCEFGSVGGGEQRARRGRPRKTSRLRDDATPGEGDQCSVGSGQSDGSDASDRSGATGGAQA